MPTESSLTSKARRFATPVMVVLALFLFAAGVSAPFFQVQKFWVFGNAVSVLSGLRELARASEWFLFAIIFLFTLVFPAVKLVGLGIIWWKRGVDDEGADRLLRWVGHLSKWSMLDVFVVAILVVTIKAAALANITIDIGIYLFTASVVLTQLIALRLERRLR